MSILYCWLFNWMLQVIDVQIERTDSVNLIPLITEYVKTKI